MGEYAQYGGQEVKIGTCADMYYLRYDQRWQVQALDGNVNPVLDVADLRFRFPWPDEDAIPPGADGFHAKGYHRGLTVYGFTLPEGVEHISVQFSAAPGYLVSLPCPESSAYHASPLKECRLTIHRNGFHGAVQLVSQRYRPDVGLVPVLCCACGAMWREEEPSRIEELAVLIRSEGDSRAKRGVPVDGWFWYETAERVLAGRKEAA